MLGGINLCVAEGYDVQALARLPVPTALYLVVSSESGWRKSEALGCGFSAHDAADNAIEAAWKVAKKGADADADTAMKPAARSPVALRDNSTIPALLRALAWGRRTQGLKMSEASTMFAGHSFTHGRVDSMGELTKLWDGVPSSVLRVRDDNLEFRLSGQRLTMCTVGQPAVVDKVVFSDDAANGFGPRLLYSADTERPKQLRFDWQDGQNPDSVIRGFEGEIARIRGSQDKGLQYDECLVYDRQILKPTDEARALLVAFNEECEIASDTADSNHLRGFLVRSAEQAARIAGNLAGWRLLNTADNNPKYTVDELAPAIALVRWYGQIIRLRFRSAGESKISDAANALGRQLAAMSSDVRAKYKRARDFNIKGFINSHAAGPAYYLRRDAEDRARALDILVDHGFLCQTNTKGSGRATYLLSETIGGPETQG